MKNISVNIKHKEPIEPELLENVKESLKQIFFYLSDVAVNRKDDMNILWYSKKVEELSAGDEFARLTVVKKQQQFIIKIITAIKEVAIIQSIKTKEIEDIAEKYSFKPEEVLWGRIVSIMNKTIKIVNEL